MGPTSYAPSMRLIAVCVLAALVSACASRPCVQGARPHTPSPPLPRATLLGQHPLCEASGAAWVPCETGASRCLLVADNENEHELFLFDVAGVTLSGQRAVPLRAPAGSAAIKDAEGLAGVGDRIFVVGSHSRRSWDKTPPACTLDEQRLAFGLFDWRDGVLTRTPVRTALAEWQRLLQADECRRSLIVPTGAASSALAGRLCDAIAAGQAVAEQSREGCAQGVNVEGVAAVPSTGGAPPRIWFGLRGPLLGERAVLLRLASMETLRFDALVTLDLHGDGVRDLAVADGSLWILAGPSADFQQAGTLWRLPLTELRDGTALSPALAIPGLPPFSEAIAVDPESGAAFLLVDGDEENGPGDGNGCPIAARYLPLDLPR